MANTAEAATEQSRIRFIVEPLLLIAPHGACGNEGDRGRGHDTWTAGTAKQSQH